MNLKPTIALVLLLMACAKVKAQVLFSQDFSSSTNISSYVNATAPASGQFNILSATGTSSLSINSQKLQMAKAGSSDVLCFARTTDLPDADFMEIRFKFAVSGTLAATAGSAIQFYLGSGLTTNNSGDPNTNINSKIFFNLNNVNGQFAVRTAGVTGPHNFTGEQQIKWYINRSGFPRAYTGPDGSSNLLQTGKYEVWVGNSLEFAGQSSTTPTQTLRDFKFLFTGGNNINVTVDDLVITSSTLEIYQGVTGVAAVKSTEYKVTLTQNGLTYDSYVYSDPNNDTGRLNQMSDYNEFTNFSFSGPVDVQIERLTGNITNCKIHPLPRNITPTVSGNKATFTITQPNQLFIEMDGEGEHPLFIFANPPEVKPDITSPNVVYWGPGVTDVGLHYALQDGKTYYISGGAYLTGNLLSNAGSNITVTGRGIISGETLTQTTYTADKQAGGTGFGGVAINFAGGGTNLNVNGITIIRPAEWCLIAGNGLSDLTADNVKCMAWWPETDGFGGGNNSKVMNSFFKVYDDNIKFYNQNMTANNLTIYKQFSGDVFQLGWGNEKGKNCTASNIYVIQDETTDDHTFSTRNRALLGTANGNVNNNVSGITISNVIYDVPVSYLVGIKTLGTYSNITLKDIYAPGPQALTSFLYGGNISNFTVRNVYMNNKLTASDADLNLLTSGTVAPVIYEGLPLDQDVILLADNGKYVNNDQSANCATPSLIANRNSRRALRVKFQFHYEGNGLMSIKGSNGNYVSANNGGNMTCDRATVGSQEKFSLVDNGGQVFGFIGYNGNYVTSNSGASALTCNQTVNNAPEQFTWDYPDPSQLTFYTNTNYTSTSPYVPQVFSVGKYTIAQITTTYNDKFSSLDIPEGYKVTAYTNDNYAGTSAIFTSSQADLSNATDYLGNVVNFNDVISSFKFEPYDCENPNVSVLATKQSGSIDTPSPDPKSATVEPGKTGSGSDNTRAAILFPNPSTGNVTLSLQGYSINKPVSIVIYNSFGKPVYKKDAITGSSIPLSMQLRLGDYILRVTGENTVISKKLIILAP